MVKYLLNSLIIFLMLSSFSFARDNDAALQQEYGPDLTKAPFFLRFAFEKQTNIDWGKSYYSDRKAFLTNYEANLDAQRVQEKADAREAADEEKERLREKRDKQRQEQDRLKAQQDEDKTEQQEYDQRQKEFSDLEKNQRQELQGMRRGGIGGDQAPQAQDAQDTQGAQGY